VTPTARGTPAGDAYLDLKALARRTGRPTDELLHLYVLEGFLARLAASDLRDDLVLKGGVLLAAWGDRRPTRDIDFAGLNVAGDPDELVALLRPLISRPSSGDGIEFRAATVRAEPIREEEQYEGVRVSMEARVATANVTFHLDINFGDPIWPAPTSVAVPRLLGGVPIELRGYPLPMVLAEKVVTAMQRGSANTRWRDFVDIWALTRGHRIDGDAMERAIHVVARHRTVTLRPLREDLADYPSVAQARWAAWRRRQRFDQLPEQFDHVLQQVLAFVDPIIEVGVLGRTWLPSRQGWVESSS
jgi:predicted nucleotidyltransferase component of viral defense system